MPSSAKATAGQRKPAKYDHLKIEKKWQKEWQDQKTYHTENPSKKKKMYVLDMFPYPSGAGLHVGHPRGYIASDVYARMKRMEGFNVLHPMGFDSFGLPAEQYAIQTKKHPGPFTDKLVAQYKKQLEIIGFSYDWSREVSTHRPEYYKWTQWIFLKLYDGWYDSKKNQARTIEELVALFEKSGNKNVSAVTDGNGAFFSAKEWKSFSVLEQQNILMHYRLAYEGFAEVNWCEELGTVLANDEIVDGPNGPVSERGGYPVIKKPMRQWFMRITAYADRLAKELVGLDWPNNIKEIQKNWIGKSEGLLFTAQVKDLNFSIQTFSAHFEACYADTFVVIAPDHPLLKTLVTGLPHEEKILQKAQEIVIARSHFAEGEYKEIEGIFTGRYIVDPLGNGDLPIWVASFALANYGTGIVKCSCHDERDFAFAKKYNIPEASIVSHR
jgi:leucyl-tRNA synthetase